MAKQDKLTAKKEVIAKQAKEIEKKLKCNFCNSHIGMERWKRRDNLYENILLHHGIHVPREMLDTLEVDEKTVDSIVENLQLQQTQDEESSKHNEESLKLGIEWIGILQVHLIL